jgi:hypothetical protein
MRDDAAGNLRRVKRNAILFGIAFLIAAAATLALLPPHESVDERARRISNGQGIMVAVGDPANFSLPPFTNRDIFPEGIRAEPADSEHVSAALDGLEFALASYPPGFAARLVKALFVCGVLRAGSTRASGTIGTAWILLAAPADRTTEDVRAMSLEAFHHELSSAVLRREGALARWTALWPKDRPQVFAYEDVGGPIVDENPKPSTGFLSGYALTNPENDFNVYAEHVFTNPDRVRDLARKYETVRRKLDLFVRLYVDADPRMAQRLENLN